MSLPQVTIRDYDYGEVPHSTILTIFGDEMTYNELKHYAENLYDYSNLKLKYKTFNRQCDENRQIVSVWLNDKLVLEKKTKSYHSCDMNYYLGELEAQMNEDDKDA